MDNFIQSLKSDFKQYLANDMNINRHTEHIFDVPGLLQNKRYYQE